MAEPERDAKRKQWEKTSPQFRRFELIISYDAQNAFGALLRGHTRCDFYSDDGSDTAATPSNVVIDDKTRLDWLRQVNP